MSNTPTVEVYFSNLGGRGVPAEAFGKFLLAVDELLEAVGERMEPPLRRRVLCKPTLPADPADEGHEIAIAARLADEEQVTPS